VRSPAAPLRRVAADPCCQGILTLWPFCELGSTNPQQIACTEEPFSSPVFGVLNRIVATTTKICTGDGSTDV